jgi:hypothetical protein
MSRESVTKAIRVLGTIDGRHKLHAGAPPHLSPGSVQVFVLLVDPADDHATVTGQEFDVERTPRGEYRLTPHDTTADGGLVEWLLACPEKDFFVPIPSESTDTI